MDGVLAPGGEASEGGGAYDKGKAGAGEGTSKGEVTLAL